MTDKAWAEGMAKLKACCRDRDLTDAVKATRAQEYRKALGHLADHAWLYAATMGARGEWFPSIGALLDFAEAAPVPSTPPRPQLQDARAREQAEFDALPPDQKRQVMRDGLAMLEAELARRGVRVKRVAKPMPATDIKARQELLRKQARAIGKPDDAA